MTEHLSKGANHMAGIKVYCDFGRDVNKHIAAPLKKELLEQGYEVVSTMFSDGNVGTIQPPSFGILAKCQVCVFVYGEDQNDFLDEEIRYAAEIGKTIITLVKNGTSLAADMSVELRRHQSIWFWDEPNEIIEKVISVLRDYSQSPMYRGMMFKKLVSDIFSAE